MKRDFGYVRSDWMKKHRPWLYYQNRIGVAMHVTENLGSGYLIYRGLV